MSTNVYLKAKIDERTSQAAVLENLQTTAAEAKRDLTDDERKTFDSITGRLTFLDGEIDRIVKAEQGATKFVDIYGQHKQAEERADRRSDARREQQQQQQVEQRQSWGAQFTGSEAFKGFGGHGTSVPFTLDGASLYVEERADLTTGSFGDLPGLAQIWRGPNEPAFVTPLFDLIGRVPTSLGSIEFYYWFPSTAVAGEVAEGALKPEADIEGELRAVPMATYAWWKGITRQALDDIPMIRGIVDGYLRRGVIRKIEREVGTVLTADTNIPEITSELLPGIREGMATVQEYGYVPNAVLLNPQDFAALDIALLGSTLNGPVVGANFWGARPVPSSGVPRGTAYVGDFREAVTFFDRNAVNVLMTDSHADNFLRNKLVLLAEARGKVEVTNAAAAVKITAAGTGSLAVNASAQATAATADAAADTAGNGNGGTRRGNGKSSASS